MFDSFRLTSFGHRRPTWATSKNLKFSKLHICQRIFFFCVSEVVVLVVVVELVLVVILLLLVLVVVLVLVFVLMLVLVLMLV